MRNTRSSHNHKITLSHPLCFGQFNQFCQIMNVHVLLRDNLRDKDGLCLLYRCSSQQCFTRYLCAKVQCAESCEAFQTVVAGKAFGVEDGIDANGMSVAFDGRAYDSDPSPQLLFNQLVDGIKI